MAPNDDGEIVETAPTAHHMGAYSITVPKHHGISQRGQRIYRMYFVTENALGIHKDTELGEKYGVYWSCDEPVDILKMGEVWTIGLRRKV